MCDAQSFKDLKERVNKLEKECATHAALSEHQLKVLYTAVRMLFWITCIFGGILLLTVVYGAIGERGFNHVTHEVSNLSQITK